MRPTFRIVVQFERLDPRTGRYKADRSKTEFLTYDTEEAALVLIETQAPINRRHAEKRKDIRF